MQADIVYLANLADYTDHVHPLSQVVDHNTYVLDWLTNKQFSFPYSEKPLDGFNTLTLTVLPEEKKNNACILRYLFFFYMYLKTSETKIGVNIIMAKD